MHQKIQAYFSSYTDAATLAFFRLAFGIMMFLSVVRFASYGWIDKFYIKPVFHFTYYGFGWVKPYGIYTYIAFILCGLSALMVAVGYKYRLAIVTFFVTFTYIELLDKTTYLNHYYFISVISFILIFLPANACFSVDAYKNPSRYFDKIPRWTTDILKLLLAVVYFYAGLAKLNSDWLIHAMPLKIWLPANSDLPLIGPLLVKPITAYIFSYAGAIYDLVIVFLLLNRRTRLLGFAMVVIFHVLTRILFPIGIFPYVMIVSSLLFFDSGFHKKVLQFITHILKLPFNPQTEVKIKTEPNTPANNLKLAFLATFVAFQLLFPFRYLFYPQELFWTEEGFRFSWRVMLMEKAGYTEFTVTDPATGKGLTVNNSDFLTPFQEKQMSFQPDFIVQYAHFLHQHYKTLGMHHPVVKVSSYVTLNGRLSVPYIDPNVNLAKQDDSFSHKTWILPFNDTIKGF
ncbi:HTTM domain-containing protein [Flavobacterium sp. Sd200]|uniref:HTTM domain-containing protein n=1 Tax=Flavobacterium sp. Sd200 TaxID=2692211 RepID=UPI00137027AA|nr:HTTM domain-containing protein [Flavobacterium sp. Sd200]MXN91097.1 HTTM domain-containing protein [Flavobacterium sp. Sd200]